MRLSMHDKVAALRIIEIRDDPEEHEFGIMEFSDGARAVFNSATGDVWYLGDRPVVIMAGGRPSGPDELQKYVDAVELGFDGSPAPLPEGEIESVREIAWS